MLKIILNPIIILLFVVPMQAQSKWANPENPIELGQITWNRNYQEAIKKSKESHLPILILFQEVPGCSNCTTYGFNVLSHPFIVEVIETHFIPLAIYNNKGGHDKDILKKYGEPSWNNPVVRIVNSEGNDLVPRLSGDFSALGLSGKIKAALGLSGQTEPDYFSNWRAELNGEKSKQEAYLSMYCFWTGEKEIAQIDGVLSTEAGFMHGREVVKVEFNNEIVELPDLVKQAKKVNCADQVYVEDIRSEELADKKTAEYRMDKEVKYYLLKSKYKNIPMTPLQAAKVNSAIGQRKDPSSLLSPRQNQLLAVSSDSRSYINEDFSTSWYKTIQAFY